MHRVGTGEREQLVYVIVEDDAPSSTTRVKIGISHDPQRRLAALQTGSSRRLSLLCTAPGGLAREQMLHRRYARHHQHGEWFELPSATLAKLREELSEPPDVPMTFGETVGLVVLAVFLTSVLALALSVAVYANVPLALISVAAFGLFFIRSWTGKTGGAALAAFDRWVVALSGGGFLVGLVALVVSGAPGALVAALALGVFGAGAAQVVSVEISATAR